MQGVKKIVVIGPESTGKSTLCELLASHYKTAWCKEYAREYLTLNGASYTFDTLLTIAKGQVALEEEIVNRESSTVNQDLSLVNRQSSIVNGECAMVNGEPLNVRREPLIHNQKSAPTESIRTICSNGVHSDNRQSAIFIDTDLYVIKVWSEFVFGRCHNYILEEIAARRYDLYLFCNIDLPWEDDPLREYPDEGPRKELYRIYKDILVHQQVPWVNISGSYEQRLQTAITAVNGLLGI